MSRPYREQILNGGRRLREFSRDVRSEELEWHMDRRDRRVTVIEDGGWQLQLESGLPFPLATGETYDIPRESWHRVIRGHSDLKIIIDET
jgi:hypothetical protein